MTDHELSTTQAPEVTPDENGELKATQLNELYNYARQVFLGVGDRTLQLANEHQQPESETMNREDRKSALNRLRETVLEALDTKTAPDSNQLHRANDDFRTANGSVAEGTKYFGRMDNEANNVANVTQDLRDQGRAYIGSDEARMNDIDGALFDGIKELDDTKRALEDMANTVDRMITSERDIENMHSDLSHSLHTLPREFDEQALESLRKKINDALALVEGDDIKRAQVAGSAAELRQYGDRLIGLASAVPRSGERRSQLNME